jgi:plastocyanin
MARLRVIWENPNTPEYTPMRRLPLMLAGVALAVAALAGTHWTVTDEATAAQSASVSMQFNRFSPRDIVVAAGTTVTWTNDDWDSGEFHDVIAADGSFYADPIGPGGAISFTFDIPGYYEYYCDLHADMYGSITVQ